MCTYNASITELAGNQMPENKLVPQNPSDEPASALDSQIRAEKVTTASAPKYKSRKAVTS